MSSGAEYNAIKPGAGLAVPLLTASCSTGISTDDDVLSAIALIPQRVCVPGGEVEQLRVEREVLSVNALSGSRERRGFTMHLRRR